MSAERLCCKKGISRNRSSISGATDSSGRGGLCCGAAQRDQAESSIKAAEADVERLQSILIDLVLVSPRSGRVQYRLARAGEVVSAGQRILTVLDLNDVYMTIYLPAEQAGRLTIGDEARTILDPIPQYVLPNTVSFVATEAQFTPKSVETTEEREKLMFRVKLQGDPKVLDQYHKSVKTGVRGLAFVRTESKIAWPKELEVSFRNDRYRCRQSRAGRAPLRPTFALSDLTLDIPAQCMAGLIGPDGVGKSTLLALIAGVRKI